MHMSVQGFTETKLRIGHLGCFFTEINLQIGQPVFSSNPTDMSHTVTERMDVGTRCQMQTTAILGASYFSRGVGGWQAPKVLNLSSNLQAPEGDLGDIDEDRYHLCDRIKMLYKEGYEPKPVLTWETEHVILIVSNLSPPCLQHMYLLPPKQSCLITNMDLSPRFFFSRTKRTSSSRMRS